MVHALSILCCVIFHGSVELTVFSVTFEICINMVHYQIISDEGMSPLDRRMEAYQRLQSGGSGVMPIVGDTPQSSVNTACKTTILFIVLHGGKLHILYSVKKVSI